ncbi:unnamed protein product [Mytilus edulis]|uniref:Endonuclease/exonuclease/phosphatase domain-containing protein n=1 Tax=Mytilus edulis TaxID=6550 RepID=A0A8S3QQJ1_MYTED|nr:unnamed protein product [Mytilus edulis]
MENHTRCSDTNDPIDSFKLPKGKAGVSILWPNAWTNSIKKLKDGNERVIAILITASQELCIINAYMPTYNTDSQFEYTECLDIIYDIIQKYQETHKVILCGDLNGTLLSTRSNKHDKMLKNFVAEMGLSTGQDICEKHTFFHHAWSSSSQIDYILVQDKKLVLNYTIDEKSSINLSAHTSVRVITTIDIPAKVKSANKNRKAKYKLQWDQMDTNQYNRLIQQDITAIVDENNINTQVDILTNSLVRAGNITIPTKLLQLKGPKWKASPEVQILIKSCRNIYKQWQEAGKQKEHPLATTLKLEKRKLRSKVRMEQAVSRQSLYQQIMDNPNTQLFYRLINRNRSSQQTSTNCLKINRELNFIPEDQRRSFASYYEDLSVPKEELFDNNYLNLCKIRQQLYEQAMDQNNLEIGKTAHVWKLKNQPRIEIRKSIVKSRMMTGTYILQSDKHKFTHFSTEATCQLCHTESEDIVHMITTCPVLSTIREKYFIDIKKVILDSCGPAKWNTYCNNKMEITRLILDWSNFKESLSIGMELAEKLEQKARNLLFQLHIKRIEILDARNIK